VSGYRLALVTDSTEVGGAEVFLCNLIAELPDEVTAVVMAADQHVLDRVTSARAGSEGVLLAPGVRPALRALREHRPDVVHVNLTAFPSCRQQLVAAFLLRLPVVLVDHLPTAGLSWKGRAVQRLMTSRAAARVAVGKSAARLAEVHGGLRPGSVASIPNGVPAVAHPPPLPDTDGCTVGILGRLEDQKGIDVALRALALVPDLQLLVMGSGSRRDSLERLTDDLMLRRRVRFLDGSPDVAPFWHQVDLLCMPSRAEALPLALLEAMHRGRPVVATAVGSVPDVVTPDVGVLVAPEDPAELAAALGRLAGDPVLRRQLGAAALQQARSQWSAERMARQYDEVYRAAVRR
jgi:glycosyltransferase involved in cell wall biosynthesis